MPDLTFSDPGPPGQAGRSGYDWVDIAEQLKAHPGEWMLLAKNERLSIRNSITDGAIAVLRGPEFEVTTRNNNYKVSPRTADIYIRYNPEKEEQ